MTQETQAAYKLTVNETFVLDKLEGLPSDLVKKKDGSFHIIEGLKSYTAHLQAADFAAKEFEIQVNGTVYAVRIEDEQDLLVKALGFNTALQQKALDIKAPMPGLVLEVAVEVGQEIAEGDTLLILEAMKMENVIKSNAPCVVKSIEVEHGEAVEKGQLLITFE